MFESILEEKRGNLLKSVIEFSKMWRKDKHLRQLEAMMLVLNRENIFILSGTGDVVEPEDGKIASIGSGGNYALSSARALDRHSNFDSKGSWWRRVLNIGRVSCVYTTKIGNFNYWRLINLGNITIILNPKKEIGLHFLG